MRRRSAKFLAASFQRCDRVVSESLKDKEGRYNHRRLTALVCTIAHLSMIVVEASGTVAIPEHVYLANVALILGVHTIPGHP